NHDVKKNYILNSLYQILVMLIPLIMTPYLTRTLGSEGLGKYTYYYSYAYYFTMFSMLGIPNYGNREIAKVSRDSRQRTQTFFEIYKLQAALSISITVLYSAYVHFFLQDNKIAWMLLGYVLTYVFDISWFFFGMEEFKVTLARNFIIKVVTSVFVLLMVRSEEDVFKYALITSIGTLLANLILLPKAQKSLDIASLDKISIEKHIKGILILFIPYIAVSIYTVMDKVMLGTMTQMNEVGFYESSERMMKIPLVFVTSLGTVMMPRISNLLSSNEKEKSEEYLYKSIIFMMFLASSMCFGIVAIAEEFVPVFFGEGFEKCIAILTVLMPSCIFLAFANVIRTQYLLPHEMDRQFVFALLMGAVTNLTLNLILIPRYASIGASIGTLVTEAVVCFFQCFNVRRCIPLKKYVGSSVPFVASGILMCVIIRSVDFRMDNLYAVLGVKILLGVMVYFGVLVILRALRSICKHISNYLFCKAKG
ncbi:MAG: flippase, partial [Ruminococcus flavefaciens]|nr:flippase [Ruminococcus flavefaciens]